MTPVFFFFQHPRDHYGPRTNWSRMLSPIPDVPSAEEKRTAKVSASNAKFVVTFVQTLMKNMMMMAAAAAVEKVSKQS